MSTAGNLRRRLGIFKQRRAERAARSMTVIEHLRELRYRLIVSLVAFVVLSVVAFIFYDPILEFMRRPLCLVPRRLLGFQGCDLIFTRPLGGFMFRLKVSALVGIVVASPIWLYQIWAFVVPGLTPKERRYAVPFVLTSATLFAIGITLAYLSMPTGIRIVIGLAGEGVDPLLDAEEYLNFVGLMFLGFGAMFELPLILFFLGLAEVVTVDQLKAQRKVALVVIFALSAVITPSQDPFTLTVLALPIYALYELTIFILRRVMRRRAAGTP
jgi:sec-independent protein translocase protein TatC